MAERARAGELIDGTLRILLRHPGTLVLPLVGFPALFYLIVESTTRGPDEALAFPLLLAGIAFVVPAVTRAAFMPLLGEGAPRFGPAFAALAPVRATAALVTFVVGLVFLPAFALLILPGFLLASFLVPVTAVLVAEGTAPARTFARAREIGRGHFVPLAGAMLVPAAAVFGFALLTEIPNDFTYRTLSAVDYYRAVLWGLAVGIAVAYWATLSAVFYSTVVVGAHPAPVPPQAESTGASFAAQDLAAAGSPTVPGSSRPPGGA